MVRFGNVLDSSGSVIPKFRKQIKDRVPITLTHPDISRYFMTIKEAAELVIQASAMSEGGDVFVLDMGDSVKIIDLAKKMINLSGLKLKEGNNREGDISIEITGLRPGEKLYEELLIGNNSELTIHPKIFRAREDFLKWEILKPDLVNLEKFISDNNSKKIIEIMEKLVSGYKPSAIIQDLFSRDKIEK
jgi:FlaA1/EpsC-like NDP-sugar epimerase